MIKNLLTLIVFLASVSCFSQARFNAGLIGGLNATQVDGDAAEGFNKAGINAGAFVRINLDGPISVKLEMAYSGKGSRRPADTDNGDFNTWGYRFRYVDVPLIAEYRNHDLFFQAGAFGAVLLQAEQEFNSNLFAVENPEMRDYDLGGIVGIGYFINERLFVQARYQQSLIEIRPSPGRNGQTTFYDGGMSNVVVQIAVGYQFGE